MLAKNRFQVYSHIIKKHLKNKAEFGITGSAKLKDRKVNIKLNISKKELSNYLSSPGKYGNRRYGPNFKGWRERIDKINSKNLAVVVWLQNKNTKEVLKSYFINVN